MDVCQQLNALSKAIPISTSEYRGETDFFSLRTGNGEEIWKREGYQRYKGQFLQDCLHGRGHYQWANDNKAKSTYEGTFFANSMEGYGRFSYEDARVFEGLFKNGARFGPGVMTHPDGKQDVGLWVGRKIVRLSRAVADLSVPKLGRTSSGKTKLLQYKALVTVEPKVTDHAKEILLELQVDESISDRSEELYNVDVRNPNSRFFNTSRFTNKFLKDNACLIDVVASIEALVGRSQTYLPENGYNIRLKITDCSSPTPKQLRVRWLNEELLRTNALILKVESELDEAIERQRLAMERLSSKHSGELTSKSVTFQLAYSKYNVEETEESAHELKREELELQVASELESVAENAKTLLLNKKKDLTNKLTYENSVEVPSVEISEVNECTKVVVTDLLAWNNEKLAVDLMKHAFLHQQLEGEVSFSIIDVLTGDQSAFRNPGDYENDCATFLHYCCTGNVREASLLFRKHDIYPDLCDARGNTGVTYAAAGDQVKIIKMLVNCGAGLDVFNDECLTPLLVCICRFLAVQNDVTNWEDAFLKGTRLSSDEECELKEWRAHRSLTSLAETVIQTNIAHLTDPSQQSFTNLHSDSFCPLLSAIDVTKSLSDPILLRLVTLRSNDLPEECAQSIIGDRDTYLFNTACVRHRFTQRGRPEKSTSSLLDRSPDDYLKKRKLDTIFKTIMVLLEYGVNCNLGEVPFPPLILATFSKCPALIELLLCHQAEPNVATKTDNLTPLHVLASVETTPVSLNIHRILRSYGADPNLRCSDEHWAEEKEIILGPGNRVLINKDEGKTPLHLLCMRYDYNSVNDNLNNELVMDFITLGADAEQQYLGHNALTLAMLRNNTDLIKLLLEHDAVDPNGLLGENMGVPLTVLILKRYTSLLSSIDYRKIYSLLIENNANPLNVISEVGNCIEFMIAEHKEPIQTAKEHKRVQQRPTKKVGKSTGGKKKKNKNVRVLEQVKQLLLIKGREILERHTKGWAVKYLYHFVEEQDYYDDISENIGKMVTPEETVGLLQILIQKEGILPITDNLYDLLEFIINVNGVIDENGQQPSESVDIDQMISTLDYKVDRNPSKYILPEIDTPMGKYNVCMYCLRRKGLQLIICPQCTMVYYCSQECNKLAIENKTFHKCELLFYESRRQIQQERLDRCNCSTKFKNIQKLKELQKEKGWVWCPSLAEPDERRRLHLTRTDRHRQKSYSTENSGDSITDRKPSDLLDSDSSLLLSSRWRKEGNEFLKWRKPSIDSNLAASKRRKGKRGRKARSKDSRVASLDKSDRLSQVSGTDEERRLGYKSSLEDQDADGKRDRASQSAYKSELGETQSDTETSAGKDKLGVDKTFQTHTIFPPQLSKSSEELRRRLNNKYQRFLEKLSELWPEFDFSMLFLPYACYGDGQLYYRFLTNRPIYMETYSRV